MTADPKYSRVFLLFSLPACITINQDLVRPWKSDINNWFSHLFSACQAENLSMVPLASCLAWASDDGFDAASFRITRSSLKTVVV
jgi:hypothetical protein